MAFFPRNFYNATNDTSSFTPLFRLLDDFDSYSRQSGSHGTGINGRRQLSPAWQPKFDIRETGESYELHGELPGMSKDQVNIEFTDPQTMLIRGKVERTYSAGSPPGQIEGGASSSSTGEAAAAENGEESRRSQQPTVEDEEDHDTEVVDKPQTSSEPEAQSQQLQQQQQKKAVGRTTADKAKYWLTERSIGEFARTFNFPARVDQDGVSASLKDGILSVTVPKAKKHEARRIAIE